ncbi:hypothetical protein VCHA35O135_250036 [Vibrio chagasii]|nr:hypothetical protein VCHA35O135_250036 [Vibrio chagasii]
MDNIPLTLFRLDKFAEINKKGAKRSFFIYTTLSIRHSY